MKAATKSLPLLPGGSKGKYQHVPPAGVKPPEEWTEEDAANFQWWFSQQARRAAELKYAIKFGSGVAVATTRMKQTLAGTMTDVKRRRAS